MAQNLAGIPIKEEGNKMASYRFIAKVAAGNGTFQTLRKTVDGTVQEVVSMAVSGLQSALAKAGKNEDSIAVFQFKKLGAASADEFALGAAKAPGKRKSKKAPAK
jgi:predicted phosphoribosyltransferase